MNLLDKYLTSRPRK